MDVKIKLSGFDELDRKLKQLPKRVENRVLSKAVLAGLREIKSDMKAAAPIDNDGERSKSSKLYGRIRQNIRVLLLRKANRKGYRRARIDTKNAFWAIFYELGTRYQPARPWFANTFRASSGKILNKLYDVLGKGIEKEALKK